MENELVCNFQLPYLIKPAGTYNFSFGNEDIKLSIEHRTNRIFIPFVPDIGDIIEPFNGFSMVQVELARPFEEWTEESTTLLYNKIMTILNEFQYRYLFCSNDYIWISVIKEHFPNISVVDIEKDIVIIIYQSDVWGRIPKKGDEKAAQTKLLEFLGNKRELPDFQSYLIDAKKHYATGEYHITNIELAIVLEILSNETKDKVHRLKETDFTKNRNVPYHLNSLLSKYCGWNESECKELDRIWVLRNNIIHRGKRNISSDETLKHLNIIEKAIDAIIKWVNS